MINHFKAVLLLVATVFLLGACSATFEEEQESANSAVREAFSSEAKEPDKENDDIQFYLPFGVEIDEQTPNNIILKNGSKTYILFYNQHEGPDSEVVYKSTVNKHKFDANKTYKDDKKFGFMLIKKLEKNLNELTVGIGGVKITTETKTKNLETEAAMMIEIVNSVEVKKKEGSE